MHSHDWFVRPSLRPIVCHMLVFYENGEILIIDCRLLVFSRSYCVTERLVIGIIMSSVDPSGRDSVLWLSGSVYVQG